MVLLVSLVWSLSCIAPQRTRESVYYVDQKHPHASDSNPGTQTLPWKTLYRAAYPLGTEIVAGDTVLVKSGTYDVSTGGTWSKPAITPANSGQPGRPITFKAHPGHSVVLDAKNVIGNPAIGSSARDYIAIEGFTIINPGDKGIVVMGESTRVKGVVIQSNTISGVWRPDHDNTDGIRIEDASYTVVRNNRIYDVRNGAATHNAAAIKLYQADHTLVENNEIYDVEAGIYDKQQGEFNTFRRNAIHECGIIAINFAWDGSGPDAHDNQAYENVIYNCPLGLAVTATDGGRIYNTSIYNNTVVNYTQAGLSLPGGGQTYPSNTRFWNNIFYRLAQPGAVDFFTYDDPPGSIGLSDCNLFAIGLRAQVGRYATDKTFTSLPSWRASYGWDTNSLVADPLFVNMTANDFRLQPRSPAHGAGRTGGVSTGAPVNIGAYTTGTELIGVSDGNKPLPAHPFRPRPTIDSVQ